MARLLACGDVTYSSYFTGMVYGKVDIGIYLTMGEHMTPLEQLANAIDVVLQTQEGVPEGDKLPLSGNSTNDAHRSQIAGVAAKVLADNPTLNPDEQSRRITQALLSDKGTQAILLDFGRTKKPAFAVWIDDNALLKTEIPNKLQPAIRTMIERNQPAIKAALGLPDDTPLAAQTLTEQYIDKIQALPAGPEKNSKMREIVQKLADMTLSPNARVGNNERILVAKTVDAFGLEQLQGIQGSEPIGGTDPWKVLKDILTKARDETSYGPTSANDADIKKYQEAVDHPVFGVLKGDAAMLDISVKQKAELVDQANYRKGFQASLDEMEKLDLRTTFIAYQNDCLFNDASQGQHQTQCDDREMEGRWQEFWSGVRTGDLHAAKRGLEQRSAAAKELKPKIWEDALVHKNITSDMDRYKAAWKLLNESIEGERTVHIGLFNSVKDTRRLYEFVDDPSNAKKNQQVKDRIQEIQQDIDYAHRTYGVLTPRQTIKEAGATLLAAGMAGVQNDPDGISVPLENRATKPVGRGEIKRT